MVSLFGQAERVPAVTRQSGHAGGPLDETEREQAHAVRCGNLGLAARDSDQRSPFVGRARQTLFCRSAPRSAERGPACDRYNAERSYVSGTPCGFEHLESLRPYGGDDAG
jgi:hypothetical protein